MKITPIPVLSFVVLALSGGLAGLWLDQNGNLRNTTWIAPAAIPPVIQEPAIPSWMAASAEPELASITERPVFAPDRKPPPPPPPPAAPDPMANIQILGIFSGQNAGVLARVDGKVRRVKLNEAIGSWTLKTISGRDVTFVQGEETRQLNLAYTAFGPPAAPATPAVSGNAPPVQSQSAMMPSFVDLNQARQDEARERLKRRNELRAAKGLPLVTE